MDYVPLCEPWPLPPSGCGAIPEDVADFAVLAASEVLWAMSGRRFGSCEVTIRPCRPGCASRQFPGVWWDSGWSWPQWPAAGSLLWWNAVCGSCRGRCACTSADTLLLPEAAQSVTSIVVDGATLVEGAQWVFHDGRMLVRADGERWPLCQDWTVPVSGVGAWSITATYGTPVPMIGRLALGALAVEIAAGCVEGSCALPAFTTEVSRQGVTQKFPTWVEIMEAGVVGVGLPTVDLFLRTDNPQGLTERPGFYNPDDYVDEPPTIRGWA